MIINKFKAYDIILGTDNERYIVFYDVTHEKNKENGDYYNKFPVNCVNSCNLEEDIKSLRENGYYSLTEFGFVKEELECSNPIATLFLTFNGNKIVPLEKIYYPKVVCDLRFVITAVCCVNALNGKEYIFRINNFGLEKEGLLEELEAQGYVNVMNSRFKDNLELVDNSLINQVRTKRKHI